MPLAAVTVGIERAEKIRARFDRLRAAHRPEVAEIVGDRGGVSRHEDAQQNQAEQRQRLGAGENILDELAERTPCIFKKVRKMTITTPTSCWTERLMAYFEPSAIGWTDPCGWRDRRKQARRGSARIRRRRRRSCRSESPETASSRREIPRAANRLRADRCIGRPHAERARQVRRKKVRQRS